MTTFIMFFIIDAKFIYCVLSVGVFLFQCVILKYCSTLYKQHTLYELKPDQFDDPFNFNIKLAKNDDNDESDTKDSKKKGKSNVRIISICFKRVLIDFKTFLRIQISLSAVSLWSFFGFLYLLPIKYTIFSNSIFVFITMVYSPLLYSKYMEKIREKKCCCTCSKWLYYMYMIFALLAQIPNVIAAFLVIANVIDGGERGGISDASPAFMGVAGVLYFLPATGYCFYQVPVHYAMSHILSALLLFILPITVLIDEIHFAFFADLIQFDPVLAALMSSVILVLFISASGASCSCYRFQQSLLETQAYLTTPGGFAKGKDTIQVPLTLMRISSFLLAIIDFLTDSIWTFSPNTFPKQFGVFAVIAAFLWSIQVLVQLISVCSTISKLR